MITYEVRGPYVKAGISRWYVWEHKPCEISQVMSTHIDAVDAHVTAEVYRRYAA